MEKKLSSQNLKSGGFLDTVKLPEEFAINLQDLEICLHEGKLTHQTLKELFELYSVKIK